MSSRMRGCSLTPESNGCEADINQCDHFNVTRSVKRDSHYVKVIFNHIKHIKLTWNIRWHTLANAVWPRTWKWKLQAGSRICSTSISFSLMWFQGWCVTSKTQSYLPSPSRSDTDISASETRVPPHCQLLSVLRMKIRWSRQGQRERRATWTDEIYREANRLLFIYWFTNIFKSGMRKSRRALSSKAQVKRKQRW